MVQLSRRGRSTAACTSSARLSPTLTVRLPITSSASAGLSSGRGRGPARSCTGGPSGFRPFRMTVPHSPLHHSVSGPRHIEPGRPISRTVCGAPHTMREIRTPGSERAKAKWLSYSTYARRAVRAGLTIASATSTRCVRARSRMYDRSGRVAFGACGLQQRGELLAQREVLRDDMCARAGSSPRRRRRLPRRSTIVATMP
jgi:hypothetical protein